MNKKILIVEDEAPILKLMQEVLEKEGFNIITANNGERGFELAMSEKPQLIILDLMLPKLSGREVLNKLRKTEEHKDTRIFILTNISGVENIESFVDSDKTSYFLKTDIKMKKLVKNIKEFFEDI
ncbi:MAG: response regulator [Candidatus Pacebacteria bacterium]|nr:response regulator [Candidatus Paceibacterota bacterium]